MQNFVYFGNGSCDFYYFLWNFIQKYRWAIQRKEIKNVSNKNRYMKIKRINKYL